ncbi:disease resistance protein At4g27190-like [Gossypium arboreum]|uniref:disease resistance protein At4g27190-like n=1 Tax=Gossypium arboreum TaxID=29729 RepID=UPI0022F1461E|nr:disease resistance protein At4g27190-like [Gossypium arboreum]
MEVITGTASNLVAGVVGYVFQKIIRNFSYVCRYRRMVSGFEKKVETLKDKRDGVLLDVDAARKNDENIYPEVNSWLAKADKMIDSELKEVKGLEDEAKNKCFISLCPNFKARYQLSKKAEEDAGAVDELLQQGGFDKVSYRDVPQPVVVVPPKDFDDFDSRKLVFNKIMEAVKDPNLNIIGVYGMPGVGKTTLVKEVIRQVKEDKLFDSVVMAVVTHTADIKKIQDQIADELGLTFKEQSMSGRASRLCQRLKKEKKIFVVLDDIWAKLDLMEVGIPFGDEHEGCTMLLTSRDLNVLSKDMDAKMRYSIGVLEHEEAWEFFKKIAGDGVESSDLLPIATEVAKKCGGLPIAIRTLATSLRNEPPFVWEDALRQLNRPSSSNFIEESAAAYSSIQWSYDRLQSEEHKQIFLLCGLMGRNVFFEGLLLFAMGLGLFHGVNTVEETRNRLLTVVNHLKASCLLLDGYNNLHVDMHDLICDAAKSIAANHVFVLRDGDVLNDWPDDETMKECDKILLACPSTNKLPDQLKCPKLTFLGMGSKDRLMKIPENFFKEMKNLKVLILSDMNLPFLPSSISLLPNLRTLFLNDCALGDIALIGELKNLEILSFDGSDIEMLPEEIGQLTKLKWLDLTDCSKLKRIPPGVFCKLSRLEELYVDDCFVGWGAEGNSSQESNCSVAELNALSCLTTLEIHFPNAKIIPKGFSFEKLRRYIILIGEASVWDWDWGWVREYSRTLKLSLQTSIRFLNNGVKVLLKKAENLYVDEVKGVEILLHESEVGDYFQQLKNLHIQNGAMIQYILKDNGDVHKIESQLETLTLQDLPKLISFCSENEGSTSISPQGTLTLFNQKVIPQLEEVSFTGDCIKMISDGQYESNLFCNIKFLRISSYSDVSVVFLSSFLRRFYNLESLRLGSCNFKELASFEIDACEDQDMIITIPKVKKLRLDVVNNIRHLWKQDSPLGPICASLECLEVRKCGNLINSRLDFSFSENLTTLDVSECDEMLELITSSKAQSLACLVTMRIRECERMREVVASDGDETSYEIVFRALKRLELHCLQSLTSFCSRNYTLRFPSLEQVTLSQCPRMKNFNQGELKTPNLQKVQLTETDFRGRWAGDLNATVEQLYQEQVGYRGLKHLKLSEFPELVDIWSRNPQEMLDFTTLEFLEFCDSNSLRYIFNLSMAFGLRQLRQMEIKRCSNLEQVVKEEGPITMVEEAIIDSSKIISIFPRLQFIIVESCPDMTSFYMGSKGLECPFLVEIKIVDCSNMTTFVCTFSRDEDKEVIIGDEVDNVAAIFSDEVIPQLEEVSFTGDCIKMISDGQYESNLFCNIKFLRISSYSDVSVVFLSSFLRRFYNLESLKLGSCNFKELASFEIDACEDQDMIITIPKVKKLRLDVVNNIRHLWKQDSPLGRICASLECLEVWKCSNLINLGLDFSFSENLTTLDVCKCDEMLELITSSKARSLAGLVTMKIRECERMREVVASDGDETSYEIIFRALKHLELHRLQSLMSFCSRNYTLRFPSLEQVTLSQCPRMKNFNQGELTTPKLQKVQLTQTDFRGRWAGDLNATVEQLYQEQVGYRGLKRLKLSEFPELVDIWSRNPQEMLDFTTLEFLEVCDSNNLRYIFNLSIAFGLGQLRQMEIKRCGNLEQVIKEEGPITMVKEAITDGSKIISIFPRLQSIIVESCQDMTCFYMGSKVLECPSLVEIKIVDCSNMTTFVCTFSRDEDKEVIIGDEVDNVAAIFSNKVAFPNLEKITISHLRNAKKIWHSKLHKNSFFMLKELTVKECDVLLNIFPPLLLGVF